MSKLISINDHFDNIKWKASVCASKYTVPIIKYNDKKKPVLNGTGVLVKNEENYYLISAYHVYKDSIHNISIPGKSNRIIPANGILYFPHQERNDSLELDIAALKLNPEVIENINETYSFLQISDVDCYNYTKNNTRHLLYGYPYSKAQLSYKTKGLTAIALAIQTNLINANKEIKEDLFIVSYNRKDKLNGKSRTGPLPYGMSGCGLWEINFLSQSENKLVKLIGVAVFYKDNPINQILVAKLNKIKPILLGNIA